MEQVQAVLQYFTGTHNEVIDAPVEHISNDDGWFTLHVQPKRGSKTFRFSETEFEAMQKGETVVDHVGDRCFTLSLRAK
jgi:hypothetical protein